MPTTAPERPATMTPTRYDRLRGAAYLRRAPACIATVSSLLGLLTLIDAVRGQRADARPRLTQVIPVPASAAASAVIAVSGLDAAAGGRRAAQAQAAGLADRRSASPR